MSKHSLLSSFKFGFRKNYSVELASVYLFVKFERLMDKGMLTGANNQLKIFANENATLISDE